ncbi:hypothetical protein NL676_027133 [Syzygium grande]|nr:hypothetical protein NL676_027133 [Syzygium grande]
MLEIHMLYGHAFDQEKGLVKSKAWFPLKFSKTEKKIDGQEILDKLGYRVLKLEYIRRRMEAEIQRASPGGPDPQHH